MGSVNTISPEKERKPLLGKETNLKEGKWALRRETEIGCFVANSVSVWRGANSTETGKAGGRDP